MLNALSGGVNCHRCLSGHPGGKLTRRDREYLAETDLNLRGNVPRGARLQGSLLLGRQLLLLENHFPNQKGVVVSETAPVAENPFDMSLEEILSDVEWEPTVEEILTPKISLVVGETVEDPEKLEPVEPALDVEPEKEKTPATTRSRCLRSSAPGRVNWKPTKKRRIRTQNMIEEGTYWLDKSAPDSVEDGCLLLGLTRDLIDLD